MFLIILSLSTFSQSFSVDPLPIVVAVPLSVGTNSARLYFQRPQLGVMDGIKVCVCPGVCVDTCRGQCKFTCNWYPLPAGVHTVTQGDLTPGSEYQLRVQSTSRQRLSRPYITGPFKTGENDRTAPQWTVEGASESVNGTETSLLMLEKKKHGVGP